ncbi:MAG: polyphenol oxidase family protein [Thermoleophilia bacterium]
MGRQNDSTTWPLAVNERLIGRLPWLAADGNDWHIAFSTREGGLSQGIVAGLNMGFSVGDDALIVRQNRGLFCAVLGIDPATLVVPEQVHGTRLALVGRDDRGRGAGSRRTMIAGTDGLITSSPAVPIVVSFADCVPVLISSYNVNGERVLALVHAGWRGMLAGIVGTAAGLLAAAGSVESAVIGPSIGPCCFTVDDALAAQFAARFGAAVVERRDGNAYVDLWACAASELFAAGLLGDHLTNPRLCTSSDRRFYSHRRDQGHTGRQVAIAWIDES